MGFPIYDQVPTNFDIGTDAPTRTLQQTQGINTSEDRTGASATILGGVGSPGDDNSNGPNTRAGTAQIINSAYGAGVTPQPNVLDQYASYTYNLAWYLMTPTMFDNLSNGPPNVNEWVLIAKSGGAEAQTDPSGNGKRSPFFPIDYYMDNLTIESGLVGSGPGSNMATAGAPVFNFTVTEPNGLTLPGALAGAVKDFYKVSGVTGANPATAYFCMVIKFFGYDAQGNLVEAGRSGNQDGSSSIASPRAIVQKIYPFIIAGFDFKLSNGAVVYNITGRSPPYNFNLGAMRGMIPAQFEMVGATVGDILSGTGDASSVVAVVDGRDAKSTPTVPTAPKPAATVANTAFDELGNGYDQLGNFTGA
jgi:hypothetical protein